MFSTGSHDLPVNRWLHLAKTYDGRNLRVYAGGVLVDWYEIQHKIAADDTPLTIGAAIHQDEVNDHLAGIIDEIRIYDRALTPAEVAALSR